VIVNETQFRFEIGGATFCVTPVTVLKNTLVQSQRVYGTGQELYEYERLSRGLFPHVMSIKNEMDPTVFSQIVRNRVESIVTEERLASPLVRGYCQNLVAVFSNPVFLSRAVVAARRFGGMLTEWLQGPNGRLIQLAGQHVQSYGVTPLLPSLGTVGNLGPHIGGRYLPALHAVVLQLDVIAANSNPPLHFLDVLLHEQVHALIYQNLGHDPTRPELEWLHELAAITTSHQAITEAGTSLGCARDVQAVCRTFRAEQRYGDLAESVLALISDPLFAWKTWQGVFALSETKRHQYARRKILAPILWERGWDGGFPFRYGKRSISLAP